MPLWLQDIEQAYNTLQELKGKISNPLRRHPTQSPIL